MNLVLKLYRRNVHTHIGAYVLIRFEAPYLEA
jgi:hypothetical protein